MIVKTLYDQCLVLPNDFDTAACTSSYITRTKLAPIPLKTLDKAPLKNGLYPPSLA